jgi:hypothetical protein
LRREKKDDGALQEKSGESEGDAEWPTGRNAEGFYRWFYIAWSKVGG